MLHARADYDRFQDPLALGDPKRVPTAEPVFLLRGQDRIAWIVVWIWGVLNAITGGDYGASRLAWRHVRRMRQWKPHKPADLPHPMPLER
jgi:hypothetical protein